MILEEIDGNVVCVIMRENGSATQLAVGDYFSDHESSSLTVTGKGKAIVRVDPSCTFEVPGVEAKVIELAVETPPQAQQMAIADTVAATEEPVIVFPTKTQAE